MNGGIPVPEQIRRARKRAKMTQTQAAALIYYGIRAWQQWEHGDNDMHPALWELFEIKVNQIMPFADVPYRSARKDFERAASRALGRRVTIAR